MKKEEHAGGIFFMQETEESRKEERKKEAKGCGRGRKRKWRRSGKARCKHLLHILLALQSTLIKQQIPTGPLLSYSKSSHHSKGKSRDKGARKGSEGH